ncbi:MAG: hypothetical protein AMXMBFR80_27170 [Dehalococcoidia bacterium]
MAAKVSAGKDEDAGAHRAEAYRDSREGRSDAAHPAREIPPPGPGAPWRRTLTGGPACEVAWDKAAEFAGRSLPGPCVAGAAPAGERNGRTFRSVKISRCYADEMRARGFAAPP